MGFFKFSARIHIFFRQAVYTVHYKNIFIYYPMKG